MAQDEDWIPDSLRIRIARELDAVRGVAPEPARYKRAAARSGGRPRRVAAAALVAGAGAVLLGVGATAAGAPPGVVHWLRADVDRLTAAPPAAPAPEPSEDQSATPSREAQPPPAAGPGRPAESEPEGPAERDGGRSSEEADAGSRRPGPPPALEVESERPPALPTASGTPKDG